MPKTDKFAMIDLGSSTVKLSVYDLDTQELLHKDAKTVNMAERFYPDMLIVPEAFGRVLSALVDYKKYITAENIENVKLVTTGVARKAKNVELLTEEIKKQTGWDLVVIPADKEAELFYLGIAHDFVPDVKLAAINVGGGSTEITFGTKDSILRRLSFPIGVSNLNEKFLQISPPAEEAIASMFEHIHNELQFDLDDAIIPDLLVHTGGELDYMEITEHPMDASSYSPSHPKQISRTKFMEKYHEIKKKTKEELYQYMPHNPKWMDGAVACTAIALAIAEKLGVNLIVPSNKNLNDGLLLEYLKEKALH